MQRNVFGISFLEILIALFIFSVGILGIAKMQLVGMRVVENAFFTSIAELQLSSMAERLRVNGANHQMEITRWNKNVKYLLPQGRGEVTGTRPYKITVSWFDRLSNKERRLSLKSS